MFKMKSKLFSPISIKSIVIKNRIAVSPMCQYSANNGFANDWHLVHLGSRASGGAGLIIQEATAVSPEGRISPGDLGLWDDAQIDQLKRITDFIKSQYAVAGIQLAHAGRKGSCNAPWNGGSQLSVNEGGWQTVAPSPLPYIESDHTPVALEIKAIEEIISNFKKAASRAMQAGYQVLEIHAAHGYLLHQFLSPLSNKRTDEFGGNFENRIRLTLNVVNAVQSVWPRDLPLLVRISATDWVENGWNIEESIQLCNILKDIGVDMIDVSSGGLSTQQKIILEPGYQVSFSDTIKQRTGIKTGAVGLITTSYLAEKILSDQQADLISIGREYLRNPNLALAFAQELKEDISWPKQYERAKIAVK